MTRGEELLQIANRLAAAEVGAVITHAMVHDIARLGHIMADVLLSVEKSRADEGSR